MRIIYLIFFCTSSAHTEERIKIPAHAKNVDWETAEHEILLIKLKRNFGADVGRVKYKRHEKTIRK